MTKLIHTTIIAAALLVSAQSQALNGPRATSATISIDDTVAALRTYCKSCHAIGGLKFITSSNNYKVWEYIQQKRAPSGALWVDSIRDVMDWPNGQQPPPEAIVQPGVRYMPIGAKRPSFARARINGRSLRRALVERLDRRSMVAVFESALRCEPDGQGFVPMAASGARFGQAVSLADCEAAIAASSPQVVCAKSGGGLRPGLDWRPFSIAEGRPLGRYAQSFEECRRATSFAGDNVVCTFTGIGWKPTDVRSGAWFGSSSDQMFCTEAAQASRGTDVCAWYGEGNGAGPHWYRTDLESGRTVGGPRNLDSCLAGE